jgi:hypothetical protein
VAMVGADEVLVVVLCWPSSLSFVFHPLLLSPSSFHLRSIPQAVAHGTGRGWCVVHRHGLWVGSWGCSRHCGPLVLCQCDVARIWGLLDAHRAGIPLLGSPGIPLHSPDSLTSYLNGEEGGLGGCAHAFRVPRFSSSPVVASSIQPKNQYNTIS